MKSDDTNIMDLLSAQKQVFYIPPYQRNYEWDKEQCKVLYKDIVETAKSTDGREHFFGTVIFYEDRIADIGGAHRQILVDGQQRITTIMLFILAARDCLENDELKNSLELDYLKNDRVVGDDELKIKLKQVEADWEVYKNLILKHEISFEDEFTSVYQNYTFFYQKLVGKTDDEINTLIAKGVQNFSLVAIQLEPDRNSWEKPQEIFESMNSLGKPLSLADLVRNYLLLGRTSDEQENLYHNYWLKIEKEMQKCPNKGFSVSSFIRDYMQCKTGRSLKKATETNYKELYSDFKQICKDRDTNNLIKELSEMSKEYAKIGGKPSGDENLDTIIKDLTYIEFSSFYSLILAMFVNKNFFLQDITQALKAIYTYIARRRILRMTQGENKNIPPLKSKISEIIKSSNKYDKTLEILSELSYAVRLPNDTELKNAITAENVNFYSLRCTKPILSMIDESISKQPHLWYHDCTLEHIMPQTLIPRWKNDLGKNWESTHDKYLNSIGNITLLRHNSELGNKSFSEKKKIYKDNSNVKLTERIAKAEVWNEAQIIKRSKFLAKKIAEDILPLPDNLKNSNNYSYIPQ